MAATLAANDVLLRFMVQFAPDDADLDDATVEWTTPFTTVAEIRIPRQEFRASGQMELAERISFNPWNVTQAHAPLGSINETRRHVYLAISALRHENASVRFVEPTGEEL
jgi:hypothetical protein